MSVVFASTPKLKRSVVDREAVAIAEYEAMLARVLGPQWKDPRWRLRNLYWITDEDGNKIRFVPNEEQEEFLDNLWYRNLILKARQLGFSTLIAIMELDQALFNATYKGVIIADTIGNAGGLFAKVEFAYDNLPIELRQAVPVKSRTGKSSIEFDHHRGGNPAPSSVTVSVSARSGTVQLLHVSELGAVSRKHPARAAEIVSGGFPTVPKAGVIVVESTAEGAAGEFYDLVKPALDRMLAGTPETQLDWRLHFFPWWKKRAYRLSDSDTALVHVSDVMLRYFRDLEQRYGVKTDAAQRAWYIKTQETQKKKMKREFPSTPKEAFEAVLEGAIFGDEMLTLRELGRITRVPLDPTYPVNTFWDLGSANTFVWCHQRVGNADRFVRTFGGRKQPGRGIGKWWRELEQWRLDSAPDGKPFVWGRHILPHDGDAEVQGDENETRRDLLEKAGARNITVLPRIANLDDGIEQLRMALTGNVWIDTSECEEGIVALDNYQHEWDDIRGMWKDNALHNWASHPCDAIRQWAQAQALGVIERSSLLPSITKIKGRVRRAF